MTATRRTAPTIPTTVSVATMGVSSVQILDDGLDGGEDELLDAQGVAAVGAVLALAAAGRDLAAVGVRAGLRARPGLDELDAHGVRAGRVQLVLGGQPGQRLLLALRVAEARAALVAGVVGQGEAVAEVKEQALARLA